MTSVLIRPDDGQPDSLKALLRDLEQAADGEAVRLEGRGVAVSGEVALKYLNSKHGDAPTAGHTVDNTRAPLVTVRADESTGAEGHPDDSHTRPDGLAIGGMTPGGEHPGGYEGVRADQRTTKAAAPARKSTPAKKTAAAAQRDSRSTRS